MPAVTHMRVIHFDRHLDVDVTFRYASLIHHPLSLFSSKFASRRHDLGPRADRESAGFHRKWTSTPVSQQPRGICCLPTSHIETLGEFLTPTNTYKGYKRNKANDTSTCCLLHSEGGGGGEINPLMMIIISPLCVPKRCSASLRYLKPSAAKQTHSLLRF